jgi:hypothetical protein
MKKIVALLLAMLMMLNLSFAMAEDTFEENLAAFLNTLNVENGDLLLNAEAAGQAINVRAGKDEAGVHAALEIAGNAMGEAMLTADTAYVSAMGQGLKVQYQTVQNFAQKIIESMMGSANLSMDQIQADFQMLASKLAGQLFPLMQALKTEEVENGVKYSVDAAVLAEALPGAIDSLLADEEINACAERYAGFLTFTAGNSENLSFDQLKEMWAENKDTFKQNLSQTSAALTVLNDGTYAFEMLMPSDEQKLAVLSNGSLAEGLESMTTVGFEGEEPVMTMAITFNGNEVVYDVKAQDVTVYEKLTLSENGLEAVDYIITENNETVLEAHYADGKLTMTGDGMNLTAEITTKEAKKLVATVTVERNGETQVLTATVELLDQALACTLDAAGTQMLLNLSMTEKGEWTDLSQAEGMTEVDENMLMSLLSQM